MRPRLRRYPARVSSGSGPERLQGSRAAGVQGQLGTVQQLGCCGQAFSQRAATAHHTSKAASMACHSVNTSDVHAMQASRPASTHLPVRGSAQIMSHRAQGPALCSTTSATAAGAAPQPGRCCNALQSPWRAATRTPRQLSSAYAGVPPMSRLGLQGRHREQALTQKLSQLLESLH
jgi:hypothetical protein